MLRTSDRVSLAPLRRDARPEPLVHLHGGPLQRDCPIQLPKGYNEEVYLSLTLVEPDHNAGTLFLMPIEWWSDPDWYHCHNTARCLKTTAVYEQLAVRGQLAPPRCLHYLTSDPWTRLPLFEKPSGPVSMAGFLYDYAKEFYGTRGTHPQTRLKPAFRPLIYQWILHAVSALSFLHKNDIMLGSISTRSFMLSFPDRARPPQALLAGFPEAYFRSDDDDGSLMIRGTEYPCKELPTDLSKVEHPTRATDIYILANFIYQCMTGCYVNEAWTEEEQELLQEGPNGVLMPSLEAEYLGDFVSKCWSGGYVDDDGGGGGVEDLRTELIQFLEDRGFVIEDDNIQNLTMEELPELIEPEGSAWMHPESAWIPPSPTSEDEREKEREKERENSMWDT